jgi:competence protein ComEA
MDSERKRVFTANDLWAVLFLLACLILGGALMIYQKSHRKLPPELLIETVQARHKSNDAHSLHNAVPSGSSHLSINVNTAPADSLELLPGIGPTYAERIVEHRVAHGDFDDLNDLEQVKGIGPKTLEKIANFIVLE